MKILIATGIFPPDIGGPATYSKTLLDELPKRGIKVKVLSFGSVRHWPKIIRHLIYFFKVLNSGKKADIIFAQDPVSVGLPSALAAKLLRKNFVLKIVGDYAWEQGVQRFGVKDFLDDFLTKKYNWRVELLRRVQLFSAKKAQAIIVPSEYLRSVVMRWGIGSSKINTIYNSFELPQNLQLGHRNYDPDKALSLKDKIVFKNKEKTIFSIGRLVPWKGFDVLIEVFSDLVKDFPNLKLFIVGSGPEEKKLKSRAADYGLEKSVIFTGSLSHQELLKRLSLADIFVLNTAYEGLSHQILEAMALRVPVVTTNVGGNPEVIKGDSGVLVNFNDKDALKEKISELLENPSLASKFSNNGFAIAEQFFSKEKMINGLIQVLNL